MKKDRIRWNAKFDAQREVGDPSPWVQAMYKMSPGPRALDLAAGLGRNAVFLAGRGFEVLALDLADKAMDSLKSQRLSSIFPVQADLDTFPLRQGRFDLVICCHFLDRRLFPYMKECLRPGGIVLYESAMESDQPAVNQPGNRDYLFRTNELLHAFLSMRIISYEERVLEESRGSGQKRVVAQIAAQKGWTGDAPLAKIA